MIDSHKNVPVFFKPAVVRYSTAALLAFALSPTIAHGQFTANSLADLRTYGTTVNNSTVTLSATGGDPHPVTGIVTPGHYWINGDHIADPTNSHPQFLVLGGSGNTYELGGATINLDTRDLGNYGRNLGHDSGVDVLRIEGSNNTVRGINLIGQDIALDTDPDAKRNADWATVFVELSGTSNTVDGANVVTAGSRPDSYGLGDAFGKGSSQGIQPFIGHRKASAFRVGEATDAVANDIHLQVNSFGHGFFVQESEDTTLTNSTVTGQLFSSQGVIDHELYQEYGHTYYGNEIPEDIYLSGAEDGVRMYTGSSGFDVDNVVVTNMRSGFAVRLGGGEINLNDIEFYGTEHGIDFRDNTTITNAKGDAVNGPLLVVDNNDADNSSVEIELVGDSPINHNYGLAYVSGDEIDINITSNLPAEYFGEATNLFRTSQFWFDNWREAGDFDTFDFPGYDHVDSVLINDTNALMVLGEQAEGNVGRSQGGVLSNGKENYYDGKTLVLADTLLEVSHENGLGNSGTELGAEFSGSNIVYTGTATEATLDDNGTIVMDGGTLELNPGIQINDEKLTITGDGVDGQGALYSDGQTGTGTRFGSSSSSNESTIFLDGDASIGVGVAGNQLLVGRIQGTGNLTKRGAGMLSMEKSNTFVGDLIIEEGSVFARNGTVNHGLHVHAGASLIGNGSMLQAEQSLAVVDGTLDLNGRSDASVINGTIGALNGSTAGVVNISNATAGAGGVLEIAGDVEDGDFYGAIDGAVSLVKSGDNTQTLWGGNNSYTGTTTVTGGTLLVNGTYTGGGVTTVSGTGTLGGDGDIQSSVIVNAGGTLSPGNSPGILTIDNLELNTDAVLDLEIGGNLGGSGYDRINADTATLGGDLNISLLDLGDGLFEPGAGDSFLTLFATTSLTGSFDNVASGERLETEGGEGSFVVTYGGGLNYILLSSFESSASLAGDYNGDGFVSQADLDLVLLNWGAATTPGGFDESAIPGGGPFDGLMSQNELDGVLLNWGDGAVPNLSAIPEPTTAGLLTLSGLMLVRRRRQGA